MERRARRDWRSGAEFSGFQGSFLISCINIVIHGYCLSCRSTSSLGEQTLPRLGTYGQGQFPLEIMQVGKNISGSYFPFTLLVGYPTSL